jgi:uncharacterized protein YjbI with pentapeptide repeats
MESHAISDDYIRYRGRYTSLSLQGTDLSNQVAAQAAFEDALFQHVQLGNSELEELHLDDVRLVNCDLAAACWYKTAWHRVEIIGCRLTGFLAGEALFEDVLFKDCQLNLAQFRFANLRSVCFEHCDMSEVDLLEAALSQVQFRDCVLRGAELTGTRFKDIDLTTCDIEGARLGVPELQGARLNLRQAVALVEAMGITVDQ